MGGKCHTAVFLLWLHSFTSLTPWGGSCSLCSRNKHPTIPDEAELCHCPGNSQVSWCYRHQTQSFIFQITKSIPAWAVFLFFQASRELMQQRELMCPSHFKKATFSFPDFTANNRQVLNQKKNQHQSAAWVSFWFLITLLLHEQQEQLYHTIWLINYPPLLQNLNKELKLLWEWYYLGSVQMITNSWSTLASLVTIHELSCINSHLQALPPLRECLILTPSGGLMHTAASTSLLQWVEGTCGPLMQLSWRTVVPYACGGTAYPKIKK